MYVSKTPRQLPGVPQLPYRTERVALNDAILYYKSIMFPKPFYVYVCLSLKDHKLYYGSTNNLERRLQEHNNGEVTSTKCRIPLKLIYYEVYENKTDARLRGKYLKSGGRAKANLKIQLTETLKKY